MSFEENLKSIINLTNIDANKRIDKIKQDLTDDMSEPLKDSEVVDLRRELRDWRIVLRTLETLQLKLNKYADRPVDNCCETDSPNTDESENELADVPACHIKSVLSSWRDNFAYAVTDARMEIVHELDDHGNIKKGRRKHFKNLKRDERECGKVLQVLDSIEKEIFKSAN